MICQHLNRYKFYFYLEMVSKKGVYFIIGLVLLVGISILFLNLFNESDNDVKNPVELKTSGIFAKNSVVETREITLNLSEEKIVEFDGGFSYTFGLWDAYNDTYYSAFALSLS